MIFIRSLTKREQRSHAALRQGYLDCAVLKGYEIVYKPYGADGDRSGRGYYYQRIGTNGNTS